MRIVIDTNVFISGLFFGGYPKKVLELVIDERTTAFANREIVEEYYEIIDRLAEKGQGRLNTALLKMVAHRFSIIDVESSLELCRDPDDDKFINCAIDADAVYIVSGDNDLLDLKQIRGIRVVTAKDFIDSEFGS